jgi:hypothetical protein
MMWSISLVLWYSIVVFQRRNVWKWIFSVLGFPRFLAILLRERLKLFPVAKQAFLILFRRKVEEGLNELCRVFRQLGAYACGLSR